MSSRKAGLRSSYSARACGRTLALAGCIAAGLTGFLLLQAHKVARAERHDVLGADTLPVSFEQNRGQVNKSVRYLARTAQGSVFLTDDSAIFAIANTNAHGRVSFHKKERLEPHNDPPPESVVRIHLIGSNPAPRITPQEQLPGKVSYLIGNNPERWHRDIPIFSRVLYHQIYNGVDLAYHGAAEGLEYDFIVAPTADAGAIRLEVEGANTTTIDSAGDVRIGTDAGMITMFRPIAFQEDSKGTRVPVKSRFVPSRSDRHGRFQELRIEVADYDRSRALIIDPQLVYSTFYGGSASSLGPVQARQVSLLPNVINPNQAEGAMDVAVDSSGMAYITGFTYSNDLPSAAQKQSGFNSPPIQNPVAFIAKFNPRLSGSASLVYATYFGASGDVAALDQGFGYGDQAYGIAVDGSGDAFVVGQTYSPGTSGTTRFPGTQNCGSWGQSNNAGSPSTPLGFVSEFDDRGTLRFSCYIDGAKGTTASRVAVTPGCMSGCEAFVVGSTQSSAADKFPVTGSAAQNNLNTTNGGSNAFVLLVGPSGTEDYASYYGGSGDPSSINGDTGIAIAVDAQNHAFITGATFSADLPKKNAFETQYLGNSASSACDGSNVSRRRSNAFVAEFDPLNAAVSGPSSLLYASYLGGTGASPKGLSLPLGDAGTAVAVASGQIWIGGVTTSCDFPHAGTMYQSTNQANQSSHAPATAGFLALLNPNAATPGAQLVYSTYFSGSGNTLTLAPGNFAGEGDGILDMAVSGGKAFITGFAFSNNNFPLSTGNNPCQQANPSGGLTSFVAELDPSQPSPSNQLVFGRFFGGTHGDIGTGVAIDQSGTVTANDILVSGLTYSSGGSPGSPDFPITATGFQTTRTQAPSSGAFLSVIDPTSKNCTLSGLVATPTATPTATLTPTATATATATATPTPTVMPTPRVPATIKFSPSVNFGNVKIGGSKTKPVNLINTASKKGGATVTFGGGSISGSGEFTGTTNCTGAVQPKGKCFATITFKPTAPGSVSASYAINSNAKNNIQISISGSGMAAKGKK